MDVKFFDDSRLQNDEVGEADFWSQWTATSLSWAHRRLFAAILGDAIRGALSGDVEDRAWIFDGRGEGLRFADLCLAMGIDAQAVREAVGSGDLTPDYVGRALVYRNGERSLIRVG